MPKQYFVKVFLIKRFIIWRRIGITYAISLLMFQRHMPGKILN